MSILSWRNYAACFFISSILNNYNAIIILDTVTYFVIGVSIKGYKYIGYSYMRYCIKEDFTI